MRCVGFALEALEGASTYVAVLSVQDGASFWKVAECFVRGSAVKYVRLQEELVDSVKDMKTQRKFAAPLLCELIDCESCCFC